MDLPRPYPDELAGSVMSRAVKETGLSARRLMPFLTGRNIRTFSMVLTSHRGIAEAHGMCFREYLDLHTLFPYSTAFMKSSDREQLLIRLEMAAEKPARASVLGVTCTQSSSWLRLCAECVAQDLLEFGDSYWRRSHQLPGAIFCDDHKLALTQTNVSIREMDVIPEPHRAGRMFSIPCALRSNVHWRITAHSLSALNGHTREIEDWERVHKDKASMLGYAFTNGQVFTSLLASDVRDFYGSAYLHDLKADLDPGHQASWPARLVRPTSRHLPPLNHVLLLAYFDVGPRASASPVDAERKLKPRSRDWSAVEQLAIQRLQTALMSVALARERTTATQLIRVTGNADLWQSHRDKVPGLVAWVENFNASGIARRRRKRSGQTQ